MKKLISLLVISAFVLSMAPIQPVMAINVSTEIIYLADSMEKGDGITRIYTVSLDEGTMRSNLNEILGSPIPFDQVDALAASADGSILYAIDKNTTKLGKLIVATGNWSEVGSTGIPEVVLSATSIDETLYAVSQSNNKIYAVNTTDASVDDKGLIYKDGATAIDINGADIVFATDGKMYLWTNTAGATPKGLYVVNNVKSSPISAEYLGLGTGNFFTGLAIRENGSGDLVGSDTSSNSIVVISKTDGSMPTSYAMYKDSNPYPYTYGDMTAGPIIALNIFKTVDTTYKREWNWTINKTADQTELELAAGEQFKVNYDVEVDASYEDSDFAVSGTITIYNPNVFGVDITNITDTLGTVVCPGEFSDLAGTLAAGATLECTYSGDLTGEETVNTVNVLTSGVVPDGSFIADVIFGNPTYEIDECISVTDTLKGDLGEVCKGDSLPKTFSYSRWVGPYQECGEYQVENTVEFETNDSKTTGSDVWTVDVNVPCEIGCTLTQGYWKTHSNYGPAPYDETWGLIDEDTTFFDSGQSYYEVFWTHPKKGNAYYQLAHQYIAAKLNMLNGADPSDAQAAFNSATVLFDDPSHTPSYIGGLKGNNSILKDFIDLAGILGKYNEGLIGPGHCSE